jgi:hypothetical protein
VEFETWASDEDIYVKSPAQWPSAGAAKVLQPSELAQGAFARLARPFSFTATCDQPEGLINGAAAGSGFPNAAGDCIGEEVRPNWASFQYIVSNMLDSRAGLARAFSMGFKVDLPADAIEFKGDWAPVSVVAKWLSKDENAIRSHYYTSNVTINGARTEIALLSFHISTKQIKNWVWSDFEGSQNPGRWDAIGCQDSFGASQAYIAPNRTPYQQYGDCRKTPALKAMLESAGTDPIWQNYCLKGTQVTFTDGGNNATLLGNSVIETLNAGLPINQSSCITCHEYASFNNQGHPNPFALKDVHTKLQAPVGSIDPTEMMGYSTYDFLWGIILPNMK